MKWLLELKHKGEWRDWTRGSLEECMEDFYEWKRGSYGDRYAAARLTTEREEQR